MSAPEVWKDSVGLGHCSIPATGDMYADLESAITLINTLGVVTKRPIVFERLTNHGTAIYGHRL